MWQYRFLFYDLPGLLARNPPLQQAYQQFLQEELNHTLHTLCQRAVDAGLLTLDASDITPLVVNIWLVVKFWFAFEQVAQPGQAVSEASGRRGVSQVLALLKPYVADALRPGFALTQARYAG